MSLPQVIAVRPDSASDHAGVVVGDTLVAINGVQPRDVIQYQLLVDEPSVSLEIDRGGLDLTIDVEKQDGEPLGIEVHSALFDQVRTCDNHCTFCFIYQLPKGMRKSLYLKDDDFRLSFLYGNFTTLTRFTEADLERVVTERLSPLYVSLHATDRQVRTDMLRNRRGATSLRWLRALLDHEVGVHGQVVVCPGVNDAEVLEDTLATVLDEYSELLSLAIVPLGVSDHSNEPDMRPHSVAEAKAVVDIVERWQATFLKLLGHRLVFAADEYYLLAGVDFPEPETYEGFDMHEDGIGMARTFELEFNGDLDTTTTPKSGFFAWVDGAPAEGYRAQRSSQTTGCGSMAYEPAEPQTESSSQTTVLPKSMTPVTVPSPIVLRPSSRAPIGVLTSTYGAQVLQPLVDSLARDDVRLVVVSNDFFGGNIGVAGLMVGEDIASTLQSEPAGHRYLLPDVCLSGDTFLDGKTVDDLPKPVEVISTDGAALRAALELPTIRVKNLAKVP